MFQAEEKLLGFVGASTDGQNQIAAPGLRVTRNEGGKVPKWRGVLSRGYQICILEGF